MKFLAIFAILAVANAGPTTRNLQSDLDEFMALIPMKEIEETFYDYLSKDEEFQEVLDYVTSDDFIALLEKVENMPEVREALKFFDDVGIDAYKIVNEINKILEIDPIVRPTLRLRRSVHEPGLRGFLDYVESIIPFKKLEELYQRKLKESKDFQALVNRMRSPEAQSLVNKLMSDATFKELLKRAKEHGVDVKKVFDLLSSLFGLKFQSTFSLRTKREDLFDDMKAFYDVLPHYELKKLTYTYLIYDDEFKRMAEYVKSEEFQEFRKWFNNLPEVRSAYKYLKHRGFDARKYVNKLYDFLDVEKYDSKMEASVTMMGGLQGFITEFVELVPWFRLHRVSYERKLVSPYYGEFIEKLQSRKVEEFLDHLMTRPEVRRISEKLSNISGKEFTDDFFQMFFIYRIFLN